MNPPNIAAIKSIEMTRTRKFIFRGLACRAFVGFNVSPSAGEDRCLAMGEAQRACGTPGVGVDEVAFSPPDCASVELPVVPEEAPELPTGLFAP